MTISISMISSSSKLQEIKTEWNSFINKCSENPMFLGGFIKQIMEFNRSKGWTPLVLIISVNNKIVGIAPLMMRKQFGVPIAKFLFKFFMSPDFIIDDHYRETTIAYILDFLFKTMKCQFAELTLPADSSNLRVLKQKCKSSKIHYYYAKPEIGHCIIPVKFTWEEFVKLRGSNFRRRFRRLKRNLDQAGTWKVVCFEDEDKPSNAFEKIRDVEKRSWKEEWRTRMEMEIDEDLLMILNGLQQMAGIEQNFRWRVWFLELEGKTLAYSLILQYKETAFIIKTSYDRRYKKYYPGIYVNNVAIHKLFDEKQVKKIDWMTDLPFHRNWTSTCLPRVRVTIATRGIVPRLIGFTLIHTSVKKILEIVQSPQSLRSYLSS